MSVMVLLEVQVKPEAVDEIKAAMKQALPDTRAFDGCQRVTMYSNQDDPTNMVLVEQWDSREHYEKYLAWRTETGMMDQVGAILSAPPSIRYFDKVDA
jgi:quinol monooxygenase YgiN